MFVSDPLCATVKNQNKNKSMIVLPAYLLQLHGRAALISCLGLFLLFAQPVRHSSLTEHQIDGPFLKARSSRIVNVKFEKAFEPLLLYAFLWPANYTVRDIFPFLVIYHLFYPFFPLLPF